MEPGAPARLRRLRWVLEPGVPRCDPGVPRAGSRGDPAPTPQEGLHPPLLPS